MLGEIAHITVRLRRDIQPKWIYEAELILFEPLAKRLSSPSASIGDQAFQAFTNWIPA
jgi:hypothetical protein